MSYLALPMFFGVGLNREKCKILHPFTISVMNFGTPLHVCKHVNKLAEFIQGTNLTGLAARPGQMG